MKASLFHTLVAVRGDLLAGLVLAEFAHPSELTRFRCMKFEQTHFTEAHPVSLAALRAQDHDLLSDEGVTDFCQGTVVRQLDGGGVSRHEVRVVLVANEVELEQLGQEGVLLLQTSRSFQKPCELRGRVMYLSPEYPNHLRHMVSVLHDQHLSTREPARAPHRSASTDLEFTGQAVLA